MKQFFIAALIAFSTLTFAPKAEANPMYTYRNINWELLFANAINKLETENRDLRRERRILQTGIDFSSVKPGDPLCAAFIVRAICAQLERDQVRIDEINERMDRNNRILVRLEEIYQRITG